MTAHGIDCFFQKIIEWYDNNNDLSYVVAKAGPYYVRTDREQEKIDRYSAWERGAYDSILHSMDVLDLDPEQRERAWSAGHALKKWYQRSMWERCASADLLERLWAFVIG